MIETYLRHLEELLSVSALVYDVEIIRRAIRDTEFEKVLYYRYRVQLANGDLLEMTERVLEAQGALVVTQYCHHWQDRNGLLIKRWDNAPHYRAVETFPHRLHDGAENHGMSHPATVGLEVLQHILADLEAREERYG